MQSTNWSGPRPSRGERERAWEQHTVDMKLQPASVGDLYRLLPLVRAYHEFEQLGTTDAERELALTGLLQRPEYGGIWLVMRGGDVAGYVVLCTAYSLEFNGLEAFVDELYIDRAFRGEGLGARVLAAVKAEARAQGINALHLEVARDNTRARQLYARAGFEAREKYVLMSLEIDED